MGFASFINVYVLREINSFILQHLYHANAANCENIHPNMLVANI